MLRVQSKIRAVGSISPSRRAGETYRRARKTPKREDDLVVNKRSKIPEQKRILLDEVVSHLSKITGMAAVVLGGSYASGAQRENSDLDIGLYYYENKPFSMDEIRWIAQEISVDSDPIVTNFYKWGAWVNGGAWIHTKQGKIDFLYRNIDQVQRTIEEAHKGIIHHDYDQQPTHGFYSVIYLAETQICIPLFDPNRIIANLKSQVKTYPSKLKRRIITDSLWGAEFTLIHARGFADQGDIYNTVGCLARVSASLTQALFALNERYFMRDKMVMETMASFPILPDGYVERLSQILSAPGTTAPALRETVGKLEEIWRSVKLLPEVQYEAKFQV